MQLLVSVRSPAEVEPALAGGADIVDAKEPSRGSLGLVAPDTLAQILRGVPPGQPLSVALGDVETPEDLLATITSLNLPSRSSPIFLKLGFAGVRSPERVTDLIECAVAMVAQQPSAARIVAVAYADARRAKTPAPDMIVGLAHRAGATGVLLDTHTKDGRGLLGCLTSGALAEWVSDARGLGLLTALAGEIGLDEVERIRLAGPDVLGVRGAACEGGRGGSVTAERVRALRRRLAAPSAHVRPPCRPPIPPEFAKRPKVGQIL
jgi:uncharacterized protein (UPF0264 family)